MITNTYGFLKKECRIPIKYFIVNRSLTVNRNVMKIKNYIVGRGLQSFNLHKNFNCNSTVSKNNIANLKRFYARLTLNIIKYNLNMIKY